MCHVPHLAHAEAERATCLCSGWNSALEWFVRDFDIGYAMGIIVGEGSFTRDRRQPYLQVKLHTRDPIPLRFLADLLGGRVYGPYDHQGRDYFTWLLRGRDLKAAVPLFRDYLPASWKREQFLVWWERHHQFLSQHSTGNPVGAPDTDP